MAFALEWDKSGERLYETGLDRGVLYAYDPTVTETPTGSTVAFQYDNGVAWNGLTGFNVAADGGETNDIYADNIKYLSLRSAENFKFTLEAYTYPDEFAQYNGEKTFGNGTLSALDALIIGQQTRKTFGFCCRTKIGDDVVGDDAGYIIHCCYGCTIDPSDADYQTTNDSPEAITFSWEVSTIPVAVTITGATGLKPTAHVKIRVTKAMLQDSTIKGKIEAIEEILYGTTGTSAKAAAMPLPSSLYTLLSAA